MKKKAKKVAPKKVVAKKPAAVKKVTPKKEVAKPVAKKVTVAKKETVAKPAPKSSHRKQRGRTAPNRALSVTKKVTVKTVVTKETSKNKKTAPVKWNKVGPKKLPVVKPQPVKKNEPKLPAVPFADQEAELFDLTKPDPMRVKHPELFSPDGSPKPWGSITPPFVPAMATISRPTIVPVQPTSSVAPSCKPVATVAPVQPTSTASTSTWVAPTINTCGVSTCDSTAGWHTVVPSKAL